jgi:hypothetical protein
MIVVEFLILKTEVDYNGRCETPVGIAGRLRPRRSDSDEEAQLTPHGKRVSWSWNQLTYSKIAMYTKKALSIEQ